MVYCPKCGTKNEDETQFCVNCGATLYPKKPAERRGDTCFGGPERQCFGLPYGGAIAGIIFGAFIILLGLAIFFKVEIEPYIGPFILIIIGLLIVVGAIYALSRRRS